MPWTEEKKKEVGQAARARLAGLTPEERAAGTARARERSKELALARRHARYAAELREAGWLVTGPDELRGARDSGPCGG